MAIPEARCASLAAELDRIIAELRDASDDENLARAHTTRGWLCFWVGHADEATEEARRAIEHALEASTPSLEAEAVALIVTAMRFGRTPWSELERFVDERLASVGDFHLGGRLGAGLLDRRGVALAARGDFDAAREFYAGLRQANLERGMALIATARSPRRAARSSFARTSGTPRSASSGKRGIRSARPESKASARRKARISHWLSSGSSGFDEAAAIVDECEQMTSADDFVTHAGVAIVRAGIATARAQHDDAVAYARAALELLAPTDYLEMTAEAHVALGEVLLAAGNRSEAAVALETAEAMALEKGSLVLAGDARALLDGIPTKA